jgi:multiple sugar transport system substrate-binding protein
MKRTWYILTVLLVALSLLSACAPVGAPADVPADAPAAATEAATPEPAPIPPAEPKGGLRQSTSGYEGDLNLWVLGYTPGNQFANPFDLAVAQFEADNPAINVEITGYPPNQEGFTSLVIAVQSGQGVDIFRLPSDVLPQLVQDDLVAPIDDFLTDEDKADIYPNVLDVTRIGGDGKAYAWPLWVVPMGMYVNLDVFEQAGVELPAKDWTWDDFVEAAKATTTARADGSQGYGFAGFIDPGVINTWGLFLNGGPTVRPFSEDLSTFTMDTPEAAAALQRYADLALVHKVTPPDFGALLDADVKGGFTNGTYAMVADATGFAPQLLANGVNFDIWPIPSYNGNQVTSGAVGVIAVAASEDQVKLQAAMDLGRYLTSAEVQEDVPPSESAKTGFYLAPGARQSVQTAPPLDKFVPFLTTMWSPPIMAEWSEIRQLIHPALQNIIFGQTDAQTAMSEIAPEINAILAERGQ